jgi:hypothetical protein
MSSQAGHFPSARQAHSQPSQQSSAPSTPVATGYNDPTILNHYGQTQVQLEQGPSALDDAPLPGFDLGTLPSPRSSIKPGFYDHLARSFQLQRDQVDRLQDYVLVS